MRKYITEKVGIVEFFEIIVVAVIISLSYYGFSSDVQWNNKVDKTGINACVIINKKIYALNSTVMLKSECSEMLGIPDLDLCLPDLEKNYLTKSAKPKVWTTEYKGQRTDRNIDTFINKRVKRFGTSEVSYFVLIGCILLALVVHLIICHVPKFSNNVQLRTKWNASVQGMILFAAGFSTVLIAIASNSVDMGYKLVTDKLPPCAMLRFCTKFIRPRTDTIGVPISWKQIINKVLDDEEACQPAYLKRSICLLLMLLSGMCMVVIIMAIELSTKYEEEEEEDEQTGEGDTLIDDQDVNFESEVDFDAPDLGRTTATTTTDTNPQVSDAKRSAYSSMIEPT